MAATAAHLLIVRDAPLEAYESLTPEERLQGMRRWNDWVDGMAERGILQLGHPLEATGRVVKAAAGPGTRVLDGPYAEAKELVGGFFLLECSLDEATAAAQECPFLTFGMTLEIRPLGPACHLARSLGWETMEEPETAKG